jgi:protein SCO1/2
MSIRRAWIGIAAAGALALASAQSALASDHLRGTVLTVLPAKHEAIVAHEAFGAMPAMTMGFTITNADALRLHAGDRIEATVTESASHFALSGIRVTGAAASDPGLVTSVPLLNAGDAVPATRFIDQDGKPFTFADFRGRIVVLSFIYTRCPDVRMCPLISANFHVLQKKLGTSPYHLVEITLDPAYDTPAVLRAYGTLFDADQAHWTFGTGPRTDVLDFAARFGIAPFHDPQGAIIHTERTAIIGKDGRIIDLIDEAGWNPGNVAARIAALQNEPANPFALLDYQLSRAAIAVCGDGVAGYSGLLDLTIVALIFASAVWVLYRAGRMIFTAKN